MKPVGRYAFLIVAVTLFALLAGAAFRSTTGALFEPLEHEFGWSRTGTSGAVTANLIFYGLTAPFAAAAMERFGVKRVIITGITLVALGAGLTTVMTSLWQLWVLWGLFIGIGTGVMALVFGAIVAQRWFHTHRGLVMGIFSAANACGQLIFLPLIVQLAHHPGWRAASLATASVALLVIPFFCCSFGIVHRTWAVFRMVHPQILSTTPQLPPQRTARLRFTHSGQPGGSRSTFWRKPPSLVHSGFWPSPSSCVAGPPTA